MLNHVWTDFKCVLQQNYTYLEQNLDSMNGLISEMFQRRIISFQEKKFIEKFTNYRERNREVIDSLFDNKTLDHFLLFLDCLKASGQSCIREALETKSARLSGMFINKDTANLSNLPSDLYTPEAMDGMIIIFSINLPCNYY